MKKKYYPLLFTGLFFLVIYFLSRRIPQEEIQEIIRRSGILGPFIFIILNLLTFILAPLSGTPILYAGYYAFGNKVIFYATLSGFISFITNFWIARIWGRPLVEKFAGKDNLTKIDQLTENYGLVSLFFLRIFQGAIHDFLSFAIGLTSMKFTQYIVVSAISLIPGTALWYYLASFVSTPSAFVLLTLGFAAIFSGIFILGREVIKKWNKRKKIKV